MQVINPKFSATIIQRYFIEKSIELLHQQSNDSYRLRINNSESILTELIEVCEDLKEGRLKNHDYAKLLALECKRTIDECDIIEFKTINKKFFGSLLEKIEKGKDDGYRTLIHAGRIILNENQHLTSKVFQEIARSLIKYSHYSSVDNAVLLKFGDLIHYFLIELVQHGYSKHYLGRFFSAIFTGVRGLSFLQRLIIIKELINRKPENFNVIFGINTNLLSLSRIDINKPDISNVTKRIKTRLINISNEKCLQFFENNSQHLLFLIKVSSRDYYDALLKARNIFMKELDILHLGYSNENFVLIEDCLLIGELHPEKASVNSTNYKIDGFYRSRNSLYEFVLKRFNEIDQSKVTEESINKIYSGVRYLRIGSESNEIESRFINYWIGLEYLFSSSDASQYTIGRLREFFKNCHALIYFKRNLTEFHRDLKRMSLSEFIPNYSDDLQYLKDIITYQIITKKSSSPLLTQRAEYFRIRLAAPKDLRGTIERHKQNVEWNLTRIYRIRNEIVHNAAIKSNIVTITSHLRYYLTFILNSIIDFLIQNQDNLRLNNKLEIEDYFILQNLKLNSFESIVDGINFENMLTVHNPMEIFC